MPGTRPLNVEERALLDRLVGSVGPALLAYAQRMCRRRDEAEDVVAEAFLRAAENVAALRACERADLYLLTIARNLCRDRQRRRRTRPSEADDAARGITEEPDSLAGADPVATVEGREAAAALRAAVDELPDPYREIVVLRFALGLKFQEIARLLDVPLGTALSRLHEAVERLRRRLLTKECPGRRGAAASRRSYEPGCPQVG